MTLLLVDDDHLQLRLMSRILNDAGFDVETYDSIADVEEQVLRAPSSFDLVISDYEMPKGDGLELAQRLSGVVGAPPMLLCTGCLRLPYFDEPIVRGVLRKPYVRDELLARIGEIIGSTSIL